MLGCQLGSHMALVMGIYDGYNPKPRNTDIICRTINGSSCVGSGEIGAHRVDEPREHQQPTEPRCFVTLFLDPVLLVHMQG